jgi:CHASE3 domain sensor protein
MGKARQDFSTVHDLTDDNPSQQDRLRILHGLSNAKLKALARTVDFDRGGKLPPAIAVVRTAGSPAAPISSTPTAGPIK